MLRFVKFLGGVTRQLSIVPAKKMLFHSAVSSFAPIVIDGHEGFKTKKNLESIVDNIESLKKLISGDKINWDHVFEKLEKLDVELINEELKYNMLYKSTIASFQPNILSLIVNKYKIPIDLVDHKKYTVLYEACLYSHPEVVKCLLDLGARPDAEVFAGKTPYYASAIRSDEDDKEESGIEIFKLLCSKLSPTQNNLNKIVGIFAGANLSVEEAAKEIIGREKWDLTISRERENEIKLGLNFNFDDDPIEIATYSESNSEKESEPATLGAEHDYSKLEN